MFNIVLVEPEIPQNTGNIVRTCAATGCRLHLVRPLGFEVSDKYLKRAGLDYWHFVDISYYDRVEDVFSRFPDGRFWFFTTKAKNTHSDVSYREGDFLVFGKETKGLPEPLLKQHYGECVRLPMAGDPFPQSCKYGRGGGLRGVAPVRLCGRAAGGQTPKRMRSVRFFAEG